MSDEITKEPVGLIGLGLVGSEIAKRLLQDHHCVVGYDIDSSRCNELKKIGVKIQHSPAEIANMANRIVLSLPDSTVVRHVIFGEDGILSQATPHTLIIDTTTGDPDSVEAMAKQMQSRSCAYVDACIAGSSRHVAEGRAVVIAGGSHADLARCSDILNSFAKPIFHMGPCGKGSQAKLVVNLVLGLHRLVLSEGLLLAEALQLDLPNVMELLKSGVSYSRVMDTKGEKMLKRDFQPEARMAQHLKDVNLILQLGQKVGVRLTVSELHQQLLQTGVESGMGELDNSAIFEVLRNCSMD
jgi:3-hydroxyisobutyrate dehydrogenase-like beta-hydroxyacid dehydrogenase